MINWMEKYTEQQRHRIDALHSGNIPRSEWSDEDFDLYIDFETNYAREKAIFETKASEELALMQENVETMKKETQARIDALHAKAEEARQKCETMKELLRNDQKTKQTR